MAKSKQELLQEAWLGGRVGTMSALTQARAWALREAWRDEHGDTIYSLSKCMSCGLAVVLAWMWHGSVQAEAAARGLAGGLRRNHVSPGTSQGMGLARGLEG